MAAMRLPEIDVYLVSNTSESSRQEKPEREEVELIIKIVEDFGIKVDRRLLPRFSTRAELDKWRKEMIKRAYDSI